MAARTRALPYQWFDSTGGVLAGGKIYFYDPGTTNDKTVWQDSGKSTAHSNPIVLDSAGRFGNIPYTEGLYDVKITDSDDVTVDTWSNWGEETTSATDLSTITMTAGTGLSGGGTIDQDRTFNVDYATQTQQEAGTATGVAVNPAVQHYHDSAAKVWVYATDPGTATIGDSYNVSSVDDDGTGDYGVNFTTSFSDTNYAVVATNDGNITTNNKSAGAVDLSRQPGGSPADGDFMILCFGDQ